MKNTGAQINPTERLNSKQKRKLVENQSSRTMAN